jgi:hypothetical protein
MIDPKDNEWLEKFKRDIDSFDLPDFKVARDYLNFLIATFKIARTFLEDEYEKRKKEHESTR